MLGVVVLAAAALVTAPAPAVAVDPAPFTGVSIRQSTATTVSDTSLDHALYPSLRVISPMVPWRALEPQDDVFDFAQLDLNVQHAAANGYRLMVRVMSGRMVPDWLLTSGARTLTVLGTDQNADDYCDWIDVVTPWDQILAAEYREMMATVGAWLAQDDGLGGTKADHVYLVPISMPTLLGSEMQIGFGANVKCPGNTEGGGLSLSGTNSARWHALGTNQQLQSWTEAAWRDAIAIHMQELPANVRSVIAYGGLFGDAQEAALRIARTEVGPHRDRLWSMYTNLQPQTSGQQVIGVWKDWCAACHDVIWAALRDGGTVGFQVAGTDRMDSHEEFATAVDDALARYTPRFVEASPAALERELDYLLTGSNTVQDRLAAIAGRVLSTTDVSCDTVAIGAASTCTVRVNELWDDPSLVPTGDVWFSADADVSPASCTLDATGGCVVSVTPAGAGPIAVTVGYGGDAAHLASTGDGAVTTFARSTSVRLACATPVVVGQDAACTVEVADSDTGDPSTPAGTVDLSVAGAGSVSPTACVLSGSGATATCTGTYTPSAAGTATVSATYEGTSIHREGVAQAEVGGDLRSSSTSVSCSPSGVAVGASSTCTATVSDASGAGASGPTGTVAWSTDGSGTFGADTCSLAGTGTSRSCSVSFTPGAVGASTATVAYGGSGVHGGSSSSAGLTADLRATTTSVSCVPASVSVGGPTTCTATVSDASGAGASGPTGTVAWSTVSVGSFGATTCTLDGSGATRTCSVVYTPLESGSHGVAAGYGGDDVHLGSSGNGAISASPVDATAPTVRITSPKSGGTVPKGKTVTIAATASDDRGVARVEFRVNGALLCTDATASYTCAWAVPKVVATYSLAVTAVDLAGNTATATITVRTK